MRTRISVVRVGTDRSFMDTVALMSSVRAKRIAVSIRRLNHGEMLYVEIRNGCHLGTLQTQSDSGFGE